MVIKRDFYLKACGDSPQIGFASERMLGELAFNSLLQRILDPMTPPGNNRFVAPI